MDHLRRVEIFKYDAGAIVPTGKFGKWHQFGCDFEEFESGPGNFTTAIVEKANGKMISIRVELIKFIT